MTVDQAVLKRAEEYVKKEEATFFRNEVEELLSKQNWEELNDRFYTQLDFGTGGLRGIIGGGYNRINPYNVQKTTQGLANYIKKSSRSEASVVIAHDSRNYSDVFALEAARVLCGNGIKTYLFTSLRSTPELSFGVRYLNAIAGIVITASHNPPEYNGYKVYWEDGAQIISPHDKGIIEEVRKVKSLRSMSESEALKRGLLVRIDAEVDEPYLEMVKKQSLRPELIREKGRELKVVYTPLHGSGGLFVSRALADMGIEVVFVPEQKEPDGNFPTVRSPNPEEASAMEMAMTLAEKIDADLVMGTDPDADRLGVAVRDGGGYRLINGNQLGTLLADYIFSTHAELGTLPEDPVFIKTIVTSELARKVAEEYGARCFDTLTGFKFIAGVIREFESVPNSPSYLFGCEESYGYLVGTAVRDKDAVSAARMTAEMTLYHISRGKSLLEHMDVIYEKHGYFEEILLSHSLTGEEGFKAMQALMSRLRQRPPAEWAGLKTVEMRDYLEGTTHRLLENSTKRDIELPSSNVLQFILTDNTIITARPSGTEPKIKFYASCRAPEGQDIEQSRREVGQRLERIKGQINALV